MASGMYYRSFARFFGGDLDYVNDTFSAYLVSNAYAPDRENDETIGDIPEAAVLAETQVDGRFISGLALFADALNFPSVPAGDVPASAVVIFKDDELTSTSYLCFVYDADVLDTFPMTLDGTDVIINWPVEGLFLAELPNAGS